MCMNTTVMMQHPDQRSIFQDHEQIQLLQHEQNQLLQQLQIQQQQDFLQPLPSQQQQHGGDGLGMFLQGLPTSTTSKQQQTVAPRFQINQDSVLGMTGQQVNFGNFPMTSNSFPPVDSFSGIMGGGLSGGLPSSSDDGKRKHLDAADDLVSPKPLKKLRTEDSTSAPPSSIAFDHLINNNTAVDESRRSSASPAPVLASKEPITYFEENDVLSGRGGGTNVHPGNRQFRDLINMHRRAYLKARKNDKPAISRAIVQSIRDSGGRFLKKDEKNGCWIEIGDDAAREKTSQALRQRAPEMRKLLFDTEREEQIRQQQQRMLSGSGNMGTNSNNCMNNSNPGSGMGHPSPIMSDMMAAVGHGAGINTNGIMGHGMTNGLGGMNSNSVNIGPNNHLNSNNCDDMNSALFQAMQAAGGGGGNNKNVFSAGSSQTNPELSQMFSAALLQGGINRFASNGA